MKNISIIFAMPIEAKKLIDQMGFVEINNPIDAAIPSKVFEKKTDSVTLSIIVSGKCKKYNADRIGTQAATILSWEVIAKLAPDLIINAGIAGGFKKRGASIGDVYYAVNPIIYHHRLIAAHERLYNYGIGNFECFDFGDLPEKFQIKPGLISSGDSLEVNEHELHLMEKYNIVIKDMEAAAIAEVANLKKIPIGVVKAITDYVDFPNPTHEQIKENFQLAIDNLTKNLILIINSFFERKDFV